MKIMNQKVEHKRFGQGTVIGLKDRKLYVSFGKIFGDKGFAYPDVFKHDMKLLDGDAQEEMMEELAEASR